MEETIYLTKRLIGKEDITFDVNGTNETDNFTTSDGVTKTLTKINASHFPLTQAARGKLKEQNVDSALVSLSNKIENFKVPDVLHDNVVVEFSANDDIDTIQWKINEQIRNLNGYTITFRFPVSLSQNIYESIVWQDFFNGTIIVTGGSTSNKITISDQQNVTSLFKFYRCLCEVQVEHFYLKHNKSTYGILAESTTSLIIRDCYFSGIANAESYAAALVASNAFFVDCEFLNDLNFYPYIRNDYLPLSGGTLTGRLSFLQYGMITSLPSGYMILMPGEDKNTSPNILLRGANTTPSASEVPGEVFIIANNGSKQAKLVLRPDGSFTLNGKTIATSNMLWQCPDYDNPVAVGEVSSYTAPADGWVYFERQQDDDYLTVKVNGSVVVNGGGYSHDRTSGFFPVRHNDVVTFTDTNKEQEPSKDKTGTAIVKFYPNR